MDLPALKSLLKQNDVVFTKHAIKRAEQRQIKLRDIKKHLQSPDELIMAEPVSEAHFNCWFHFSNNMGHLYAIHLNAQTRVLTVIKIRSRWQREVEKHAKKIPKRLRL